MFGLMEVEKTTLICYVQECQRFNNPSVLELFRAPARELVQQEGPPSQPPQQMSWGFICADHPLP